MKLKKSLAVIMSIMLIGGSLVGCSSTGKEDNKTLYFIPIVDTGAYWSPMKKAAQDRAKELGYDLVFKTSPPNQPQKNEKHLGFLEEAISEEAAGIAIAPIDPDMFDRKIKEATDAGIPVVTFDADVNTPENRLSYVGTDNKLAGIELGKQGATYLKEKGITSGKISLVAVNLTQTTMISRKDGIKEGFKEVMGKDAANFTWLEPIQDDDQSAESKRQLEGQITANDDMVAVFSLGSEGPDTGVMEAIKSQGKEGKIYHFGFDYTPTWENGIDKGLITGIVDQDSYAIGRQVIDTLVESIEGKEVKDNYPVDVKWVLADEIVDYGKQKQEQFTTETTE